MSILMSFLFSLSVNAVEPLAFDIPACESFERETLWVAGFSDLGWGKPACPDRHYAFYQYEDSIIEVLVGNNTRQCLAQKGEYMFECYSGE